MSTLSFWSVNLSATYKMLMCIVSVTLIILIINSDLKIKIENPYIIWSIWLYDYCLGLVIIFAIEFVI